MTATYSGERAGWEAFRRGVALEANPYSKNDFMVAHAWDRGWSAAKSAADGFRAQYEASNATNNRPG